ncbi:hypothetical protein NE237_002010 [Protea cynaroides]|uniref:NB-ARC domain-containing protein n=1 Tax=Protea cynaroides TaxID=273540 RepID=A0A9Q0QYZ7_9MAGN|nr:hypothetical protein NE237_002010 [Protea cynaroides]
MDIQRYQSEEIEAFMKKLIDIISEVLTTNAIESWVSRSRIEFINSELKQWDNRCFRTSTASSSVYPQLSPYLQWDKDNDMVQGLENDATMLIKRLNEEDPRQDVIPIVGPKGVGKTMLARRVFEDPDIVKNFPCRVWIYAYNHSNLSIKKLLQGIINPVDQSSTPSTPPIAEDNPQDLRDLAIQAYNHLKTKRYLLVFDDVLSTQFWADINMIFPNNKNGGGDRIIFTTRYDEVALFVRPRRCPFYLQSPFHKEESSMTSSDKAKTIINSGERSWKEPWNNWVSSEMIYNNLPHHLKFCLLYLAVLNSCRIIQFKDLITAEGLVQPPRKVEKFVDDLIKMNLVEVVSKHWDGSIKEIAIVNKLELMNFCRYKAREEISLEFASTGFQLFLSEANRIAIERWTGYYGVHPQIPMKARSVLILKDTNVPSVPSKINFGQEDLGSFLQNNSPLRVLDMGVDLFHTIPDEIDRLIHLRYLSLKFGGSGVIFQPSICNLLNLQFLRVKNNRPRWLPLEFWRMRKLISLSCSGVLHLPQPPEDLVLDNLQILKNVSVLCCTDSILSKMPNLIRLGVGGPIQHTNETISLPRWDVFPQKITHLTFNQTGLVGESMKILGKLPNLEVLKLAFNAIEGDDLDVVDDGFCRLKCLKLEEMDIRKWNMPVGAMPSLEIVVIKECCALVNLPSETLMKIGSLRELKVYNYVDPAIETAAISIQEHAGKDRLQLQLVKKSN